MTPKASISAALPLLPTKIADAQAKLAQARRLGCRRLLVMTSAGKDSVALVDMVMRSGIEGVFVSKYLVPNLDIDEEVLTALERRYRITIKREAQPRRTDMFDSDTLGIRHVNRWRTEQPPSSRVSAHTAAFDKRMAKEAQTGWMTTGIRKTDGVHRRLTLTRYQNPNPATFRVYPLADWTPADAWALIQRERLPKSRAYALFGRSLDCLNVLHVWPLKAGSPADYRRILSDFPLLEPLCWLYERRAAREGLSNLPKC